MATPTSHVQIVVNKLRFGRFQYCYESTMRKVAAEVTGGAFRQLQPVSGGFRQFPNLYLLALKKNISCKKMSIINI